MTSQHTPGPWRVTEEISRFSGGEVIRPSRGDGVDSPVAFVCDFNRYDRDEERQANARLIATAPELLAVVERLVDQVPHGCMHIPNYLVEAATDALRKVAEGRAP